MVLSRYCLLAAAFVPAHSTVHAQTPPPSVTLPTVEVTASADASAEGLSPAYAGGQVARGARIGILGTIDALDSPFSATAYTNALIQDRHARSVGDVLQNDPGVRVARGFGNFQESYFIRGFILGSDDVAYNGLYSLLPRQYIATELFERVEVLRGASAFLNGANPGGGGIGGAINLLPKRAPNEPLTRAIAGHSAGGQYQLAADVARRFGPDASAGLRVNVARRHGGTAVDHEKAELSLAAVGLDWRGGRARLSADLGWQDNQLDQIRTNVTLAGVGFVPRAPESTTNWAQPWTYSNERDVFGTLRGEYDFNDALAGFFAYGARRSEEANSLANLRVTDAGTGAGTTSRFDNTRKDRIDTGEIGLRGRFATGFVEHKWVLAGSWFRGERDNAFKWDFFNTQATNLYTPTPTPTAPPFSGTEFSGGDLANPNLTGRVELTSVALGDTLSLADGRVLVTLGLRNQKLDIANFAYGTSALIDRYVKRRTSPAVGVVFKPVQGWSLYGNYIEGLSQGETAPGTAVNAGTQLPPYVSEQVEVGFKFDRGGLGGGLALFETSRPRGVINADNVFTSEGKDRHRGLEATVYGELSRRLRVLGGATWLDAKQDKTGSATTDAKRVIGVPGFQANLGAEWDVPGIAGLALDARVVHTGAVYADATNRLKVPAWTRFDLGARYITEIGGHALTLRARIDNLTDRDYWASSGGFPGQGYLVLGAPRTVSVSASMDF